MPFRLLANDRGRVEHRQRPDARRLRAFRIAQGFKKFNRRDIVLEVGKTSTIDVKMEVGSFEETVNVSAESPLVDVTSKSIGGNITYSTSYAPRKAQIGARVSF